MMLNFLEIIFILLALSMVYLNLIDIFNYVILINLYPYLLIFTILAAIASIITHLVKSNVIHHIFYGIIAVYFIFFSYTFFRIYHNVKKIENIGAPSKITLKNEASFIYEDTTMFDEIIEAVSGAKNHIHIEFFIYRDDHIGKKIKDLLIQKTKEGIHVRLIYDGIGSIGLDKNYIKELKENGVEIRPYNNIIGSIIKGKLNNRNHRKIVIVDGKIGFMGGINIGDEYLGRDKKVGNWKDSLVKIKGEAVHEMQKVFLQDWHSISGEAIREDASYFPKVEVENTLPIKIIQSGYDAYLIGIKKEYYELLSGAKKRIYIVTPYLFLDENMLEAIQHIANKGGDVRIILPKNTDHPFVGWVNNSFFRELLQNNVKIYQYSDGFLHSKIILVDEEIVSVGSANFNVRSQYLDYEMNAMIFSKEELRSMLKELNRNMKNSEEMTLQEYENSTIWQKLKAKLGVLIRPFI